MIVCHGERPKLTFSSSARIAINYRLLFSANLFQHHHLNESAADPATVNSNAVNNSIFGVIRESRIRRKRVPDEHMPAYGLVAECYVMIIVLIISIHLKMCDKKTTFKRSILCSTFEPLERGKKKQSMKKS